LVAQLHLLWQERWAYARRTAASTSENASSQQVNLSLASSQRLPALLIASRARVPRLESRYLRTRVSARRIAALTMASASSQLLTWLLALNKKLLALLTALRESKQSHSRLRSRVMLAFARRTAVSISVNVSLPLVTSNLASRIRLAALLTASSQCPLLRVSLRLRIWANARRIAPSTILSASSLHSTWPLALRKRQHALLTALSLLRLLKLKEVRTLLNALSARKQLAKSKFILQSLVVVLQMLPSLPLARPYSLDLRTQLLISALLVSLLPALLFSNGSRVKSSHQAGPALLFTSAEPPKHILNVKLMNSIS